MLIFRLFPLILICPLLTPRPAQAATDSPVSEAIAPIIFIGHPPKNHYVILIPSPQEDSIRSDLARIRDKIAPTGQIPFVAQHRLGRYIYAGSFTERNQAENTRQRLLSDETRARIVYFP
jgi:cell division protein FtsN